MKNYRKTIIASVLSLVLGLSCCWLSSIIIWLGGASIVASMSKYLDGGQTVLLGIGILLIFVSIYLYRRSDSNNILKK